MRSYLHQMSDADYDITLGRAIDGLKSGKYTSLEANEPLLQNRYMYYSYNHPSNPYRWFLKESEQDYCAVGLHQMDGVLFREYRLKQ